MNPLQSNTWLPMLGLACLASCNSSTNSSASFDDLEVSTDCEVEAEVRMYQDGTQRALIHLPATRAESMGEFNANDIDFDQPVRIRIIITRVEGECDGLQEGQIFYYPSQDDWAELTPEGGGYRADFGSFGIVVGSGRRP